MLRGLRILAPALLLTASACARSSGDELQPTGSRQPFRSGDVLLAPGAVVDFVIGAQLFNSTVTRRP